MRSAMTLILAGALVLLPLVAHAQLMIIGNDDKITVDKTSCRVSLHPCAAATSRPDHALR